MRLRLPRLAGCLLQTAVSAALVSCGLVAGAAGVAQGLPATSPTGGQLTAPLAASPMTSPLASQTASRMAKVSCEGGQIEVRADNSSLNQVLNSIALCTGMRIVGGVPDQRVFGTYGPAAPATVIATLLDGTGTNMLLQESMQDQPRQLILTPRLGGVSASPSSGFNQGQAGMMQQAPQPQQIPPNGQIMGMGGTLNRQPGSPHSNPGAVNNVNGSPANAPANFSSFPNNNNSMSPSDLGTPSTTPSPSGIVDYPNPPPAGSDTAALLNSNGNANGAATSSTSSVSSTTSTTGTATGTTGTTNGTDNGALTPEAVFQRLKDMQQQLQNQNPAPRAPQ